MAHITCGGLIGNVPRMLPAGLAAEFAPASWSVPLVFGYLVGEGNLAPAEAYRALNMGLGFVLAVGPDDVAVALGRVPDAVVVGRVVPRGGDDRPVVRGLAEGRDAGA